jgi:hypothetical protein
MTLRFEAEVRTVPKGPFEKCLVTAEAWGGDFAAFFRVISCEKLPAPDQAATQAQFEKVERLAKFRADMERLLR